MEPQIAEPKEIQRSMEVADRIDILYSGRTNVHSQARVLQTPIHGNRKYFAQKNNSVLLKEKQERMEHKLRFVWEKPNWFANSHFPPNRITNMAREDKENPIILHDDDGTTIESCKINRQKRPHSSKG